MRTLIWSKTFIRAAKRYTRKHPSYSNNIQDTLRILAENPFALQLETHKLKGKLAGSWACRAGYDLRIIFNFVKSEKCKEDDIFLIEIGTHDEVY